MILYLVSCLKYNDEWMFWKVWPPTNISSLALISTLKHKGLIPGNIMIHILKGCCQNFTNKHEAWGIIHPLDVTTNGCGVIKNQELMKKKKKENMGRVII